MSIHVEIAFARSQLAQQIWATLSAALLRYVASVQRSAHAVASHNNHKIRN